jgi:peptidoglycan/xylan/chitin deacetylase (PgdA/CDA1 family)
MKKAYLLSLFLFTFQCVGQTKEIAITIDDLPLVASKMNTPGNQQRSTERFEKIIQAFTENQVPATGFIIAGAIEKGQWVFLEQFRKAGLSLGNHTYSHRSAHQLGAYKYIADISRADKIIAPLLTEPKYFRFPYLDEGSKQAKPIIQKFLADNHYIVAPVTIDSKDFEFNEQLYHIPYRAREKYINQLKKRYLSYVWNQTVKAEKKANGKLVKQILLIHANLLNSYALNDLIQMYKQNGYTFITLADALKNPAPEINYQTGTETSTNESESQILPISSSAQAASPHAQLETQMIEKMNAWLAALSRISAA